MNDVTPQPRVAILGTGKMGSAIAGRLSGAGFELTLWNRTRERADALGIGHVAETPIVAVRNADVIISSLTGPDAVRAAYLGPTGVHAQWGHGGAPPARARGRGGPGRPPRA